MPNPPFADAAGPAAIRAGRLLDVETGELALDRTIHVDAARVTAVAAAADGEPDGARRLDLGGLTVLPGLIDTHSHLVGEVQTAGVPGTTTSSAQEALLGVRNARDTIEAGFTTVRDVGTFRAFVDCALRDAIDAGDVEGPRMQCAGAFITAPWGGGDVVGLAHDIRLPDDLRFGVVTSAAEVRDRVRRLMIGGADLVKCIGTGAVLTRGGVPGAPELSEEELRAAVEEAAHYGRYVAVHAHSSLGAQRAIRAGARSVEHGSMVDDDTIAMLADTGTFYSVDLYDGEWALEHGVIERWPAETMAKLAASMDSGVEVMRRAVELGVRIVYGTDSGVYPHALVAKQFAWFVRCGMTPLAAIRSATVTAAACMGWSDRVGTLAPGRVRRPRGRGRRSARGRDRARAARGRRQGRTRRVRRASRPGRRAGLTLVLTGIDHLVLAVRDPDDAAARLERDVGLAATGGGRHEAWGTFNRLAFLGDTYVELIGVLDRGLAASDGASPVARAALAMLDAGREGLATFAVATDDIVADVARLRAAGSSIGLPVAGSRVRPDGGIVRWWTASAGLGPAEPPFLIEHDVAGAEWDARARADRAAFRHPAGGRVRLAALELPVPDPARAAAAFHDDLGLAFDAARQAAVGGQSIRLRAAVGAPPIVDLVGEAGSPGLDVLSLGVRWRRPAS